VRITGPNVTGPPEDREAARAVLRRAVELGVNLIDTADSYGPDVSEELIADALHPYPHELVIATKGGLVRPPVIAANACATVARSTSGRRARARSSGCAWSGSTSTSCTGRIRTCRTPSPWER